jgi:N4-gp56 family major capsid protein
MASKEFQGGGNLADPLTTAAGANANVDLLKTSITSHYATITAKDSDLRSRVWSELVTRDAREKNVFDKFIGGEGSGKPIVEKRDLSAGGSDKVTFTTVAPIRGQGVRGEDILKNKVGSLSFGTFGVEVDLIRHAVAWTQVLKLMRFTGKTLDQLSAEVMAEWAARMEQDLIQYVLRDTLINAGNTIAAYGAGAGGSLAYGEGLSTDIIQEAKQALIAEGGAPMNTAGDDKQEIPGYLFFAPDACLRPLRSDSDYLEAITHADVRGDSNKLFSGSYAKWDNNIIANHNVILDTADGRQGSPLAPTWVYRGAAALNVGAGSIIGVDDADCFANFPGAALSVPGSGGAQFSSPAANAQFVMAIAKDKTYCVHQVAGYAADNAGANTGVSYIILGAEVDVQAAGGLAVAGAGNAHAMTGPVTFMPCNDIGTPIGHALALGENAMYFARGSVTNEQIFHYDDFANSGNDAHLSAVGLQSVYGMAAYQDTKGRIPAAQLIECVRQVPGLSLNN